MAHDRRFCTSCGAQLGPDARFCGACGAQVEDERGFAVRPAEHTERLSPTPGLPVPAPARVGAPVTLILVAGALAAALVFAIGLFIWWPAKQTTNETAPQAAAAQPSPAAKPTGGSAKPAARPAAASAEDVANAFCEAIERGDGRAAKTYVAADAELEYELDLVGQGDIETTGYSLQPDSVAGAREKVFKVVLYYHDPETGQDYDEVYELALRDSAGRWKVSRWVLGARD